MKKKVTRSKKMSLDANFILPKEKMRLMAVQEKLGLFSQINQIKDQPNNFLKQHPKSFI